MLVLTRTIGEEIVIDGNIRVKICEVKGGRVKLAIEAPRDVKIRREEMAAIVEKIALSFAS